MDKNKLQALSPVWSRASDLVAVRGEGATLFDEQGNAYLDFMPLEVRKAGV